MLNSMIKTNQTKILFISQLHHIKNTCYSHLTVNHFNNKDVALHSYFYSYIFVEGYLYYYNSLVLL